MPTRRLEVESSPWPHISLGSVPGVDFDKVEVRIPPAVKTVGDEIGVMADVEGVVREACSMRACGAICKLTTEFSDNVGLRNVKSALIACVDQGCPLP